MQVARTSNTKVTQVKTLLHDQPVRRPCADLSVGREREAVPRRGLLLSGCRGVPEEPVLGREPGSPASAFGVDSISPSKTFSDGSFLATFIANLVCMLQQQPGIVTDLCDCDCSLVTQGVCLPNLLTDFVVGDAKLA